MKPFASFPFAKLELGDIEYYLSRPSRNRTYIGNLEGFCPNPLDDRPKIVKWVIQDLNL